MSLPFGFADTRTIVPAEFFHLPLIALRVGVTLGVTGFLARSERVAFLEPFTRL